MPTKAEKERRKQIQRELAKKEYEEFINSIPVDKELLLELFDYLDKELEKNGCNHDFSITKEFFSNKQIDNESIFDWFEENGGYCDCEILYNIEEKLE